MTRQPATSTPSPGPGPSVGPVTAPPLAAAAAPANVSSDTDTLTLTTHQAQALVRLVESAPAVRRRYQFFVWTQSQMQALLPHQVLVCGAYLRQRRDVVLDAFHNIVLPPTVLAAFTDTNGPLVSALVAHWLEGRGRPRAMSLADLPGQAGVVANQLRDLLGYSHLLVHGVSRPQRPAEIESLFILAGTGGAAQLDHRAVCLELVLPHLHSTWLRVTATEMEITRPAPSGQAERAPSPVAPAKARGAVTDRERQILRWIREGHSNQQIAEELSISPLTVKNHVQKILRKLGAGNRAQAVAQALAQQLIDPAPRSNVPS